MKISSFLMKMKLGFSMVGEKRQFLVAKHPIPFNTLRHSQEKVEIA